MCPSLLGHMAACTYVAPFARLHLYCLQAWLNSVYSPSKDHINSKVTVLIRISASFFWWSDPDKVRLGVLFTIPTPSTTIVTDATLLGRGAHLYSHTTQGTWTTQEARLHPGAAGNSLRMQGLPSTHSPPPEPGDVR